MGALIAGRAKFSSKALPPAQLSAAESNEVRAAPQPPPVVLQPLPQGPPAPNGGFRVSNQSFARERYAHLASHFQKAITYALQQARQSPNGAGRTREETEQAFQIVEGFIAAGTIEASPMENAKAPAASYEATMRVHGTGDAKGVHIVLELAYQDGVWTATRVTDGTGEEAASPMKELCVEAVIVAQRIP